MTELNLNEIKAHHERTVAAEGDQLTVSEHERGLLLAEVELLNGALSIARGMLGASRRQVEEQTADVVSLGSRRDELEARCAQMEADHAETVAEVERVRELHSEFRIYEECGHESEDHNGDPFEVDDVGWTCQDGYLYSICRECCTDGSSQTEDCASGHRHDGSSICNTRRTLDGGEQP